MPKDVVQKLKILARAAKPHSHDDCGRSGPIVTTHPRRLIRNGAAVLRSPIGTRERVRFPRSVVEFHSRCVARASCAAAARRLCRRPLARRHSSARPSSSVHSACGLKDAGGQATTNEGRSGTSHREVEIPQCSICSIRFAPLQSFHPEAPARAQPPPSPIGDHRPWRSRSRSPRSHPAHRKRRTGRHDR